jgi:hypothetical protein
MRVHRTELWCCMLLRVMTVGRVVGQLADVRVTKHSNMANSGRDLDQARRSARCLVGSQLAFTAARLLASPPFLDRA